MQRNLARHRCHEQLYTYSEPDNEPEIVSLRTSIIIETHTPTNTGRKKATPDLTIEPQGTREVIVPDTREFRTTSVYRNIGYETSKSSESVPRSPFSLEGPAIIEEETTTIFVPENDTIRYNPAGFYLLEINNWYKDRYYIYNFFIIKDTI